MCLPLGLFFKLHCCVTSNNKIYSDCSNCNFLRPEILNLIYLVHWFLNFRNHQYHSDGLLNCRLPFFPSISSQLLLLVSDYIGLGYGPIICISNKVPVDANTAGQGTTVCEPLIYPFLQTWSRIPMYRRMRAGQVRWI